MTWADGIGRWADISPCRVYRYALTRTWDRSLPRAAFIGLNPSTADGLKDDATIRRCIRFARDSGHGSLVMLNLFAYRATDPRQLAKGPWQGYVGPRNDEALAAHAGAVRVGGGLVVCAWGANPVVARRRARTLAMLGEPLHVLALTKTGEPAHPLRLTAALRPVRWLPT